MDIGHRSSELEHRLVVDCDMWRLVLALGIISTAGAGIDAGSVVVVNFVGLSDLSFQLAIAGMECSIDFDAAYSFFVTTANS